MKPGMIPDSLSMGNYVGDSSNISHIDPETLMTKEEFKAMFDDALAFNDGAEDYDTYRVEASNTDVTTFSLLPEDLSSSEIPTILDKLHKSDHNVDRAA